VRLGVLVSSCLLLVSTLGLSLGGAAAQAGGAAPVSFRESVTAPTAGRSLKLQPPPTTGTSGGVYTTADGSSVHVYSATEYVAADPSFNQHWADFLASAPHGDELSLLTLVLLPLTRVQTYCGAQALACYSGDMVVAPGTDPAPDLTSTSIILHEYGHHIAYHRDNDPWAAVDYGTKRWASDENVCRRTVDGFVYPGDEDAHYQLNPGEAWAETYRVMAEQALGLPSPAWQIVSSWFYPDAAALAAASADVLQPWAGNTKTMVTGSLRKAQKQARIRFDTPQDGTLAVTLANRTKTPLMMRVVDGSGTALATATVANGRSRVLRSSICGQRLLRVLLTRTATGAGSYAVTISKP
jgi:hypothetical protein